MAMGKRKRQRQEALFITADQLPQSAGHPFYQQLNRLLAEAGFDPWIEKRCERYYAQEEKRGQPSIHGLRIDSRGGKHSEKVVGIERAGHSFGLGTAL